MNSQKPSRLSTVCAVILAISYVVIGASYLLLPAEQRGGTLLHNPEKFLISMSRSPALMWLGYGLVGLWVLGASWILMKKRQVPFAFGLLGIGVGLGYLLVEVGTVLRSEEWLSAAAIAAIIAAPTWYVWLALILQKKRTVGLGSFS